MEQQTFVERVKADPIMVLVALISILYGVLFFYIQGNKFLHPEATSVEMAKGPCGQFDWGYLWSDTTILGSFLLIGGIILFLQSSSRLGQLLSFTGFAINLYATVFLCIGFKMVDYKMSDVEWAFLFIVPAFVGLLCMVYLARAIVKPSPER